MNKLEEKIKNLSEIDFPNELHAKIMKKVFTRRFRSVFAAIAVVVILNLTLSGWRIGTKMAETGAVSAFKIILSGFEPSYDFVSDLWGMIPDYLPVFSATIFLVNLVLIGYLSAVYFNFRRYERFQLEK